MKIVLPFKFTPFSKTPPSVSAPLRGTYKSSPIVFYTVWISSRNSVIKSVVQKIGEGPNRPPIPSPTSNQYSTPRHSSLKSYVHRKVILLSIHHKFQYFSLLNPFSNFKNFNGGWGAIAPPP